MSDIKVGQQWSVSGSIYRVQSLHGEDSQYPIVMETVRLSAATIITIKALAERKWWFRDNPKKVAEYMEQMTHYTMNVERQWFERADVKLVQES